MSIFGDSFIQAEESEQAEEGVKNIREVTDTRAPRRHYRKVEDWPIDLNVAAVPVGEYEGDTIIHVRARRAEYTGPGEFLAKNLPELKFEHYEIWERVCRAVIETEDGYDVRPMAMVGSREEPHRQGIPPHQFAGPDAWS